MTKEDILDAAQQLGILEYADQQITQWQETIARVQGMIEKEKEAVEQAKKRLAELGVKMEVEPTE